MYNGNIGYPSKVENVSEDSLDGVNSPSEGALSPEAITLYYDRQQRSEVYPIDYQQYGYQNRNGIQDNYQNGNRVQDLHGDANLNFTTDSGQMLTHGLNSVEYSPNVAPPGGIGDLPTPELTPTESKRSVLTSAHNAFF